jgi:hypothetical protein
MVLWTVSHLWNSVILVDENCCKMNPGQLFFLSKVCEFKIIWVLKEENDNVLDFIGDLTKFC